jgi:hypothetical protein
MPGFNGNVLEFQRRDARRETAAGIAGQNGNVLELLQRDTRRKTAAGNAGQNEILKIKPTRRRQLLMPLAMPCKTKFLKINRRDAVSFCF